VGAGVSAGLVTPRAAPFLPSQYQRY